MDDNDTNVVGLGFVILTHHGGVAVRYGTSLRRATTNVRTPVIQEIRRMPWETYKVTCRVTSAPKVPSNL